MLLQAAKSIISRYVLQFLAPRDLGRLLCATHFDDIMWEQLGKVAYGEEIWGGRAHWELPVDPYQRFALLTCCRRVAQTKSPCRAPMASGSAWNRCCAVTDWETDSWDAALMFLLVDFDLDLPELLRYQLPACSSHNTVITKGTQLLCIAADGSIDWTSMLPLTTKLLENEGTTRPSIFSCIYYAVMLVPAALCDSLGGAKCLVFGKSACLGYDDTGQLVLDIAHTAQLQSEMRGFDTRSTLLELESGEVNMPMLNISVRVRLLSLSICTVWPAIMWFD